MLDLHNPVSNSSSNSSIMSRKRTRSKSEDVISNHFTQPIPMTEPDGAPRQSLNIAAPFSYEDAPTRIRNSFDYTRITYEMAKEGLAPRPVRVYADGAFDLFHQGHARVLMQAKKALPNVYLIVGVCSDKMLHKRKGRTVLTEEERYNAIRHCRYVDEVVPDAPWTITDEFLEQHKIDFVAHDDVPYASGSSDDIYEHIKKRGMFLVTERTEGVSTSDIVSRIVKDYDVYLRRNLERGYSAKELNVSYLKEKRIKLQSKMGELKDKARDKGKKVVGAIDDFVTVWEDKSREVIDNFLLLFSKKRLRTIWDKSTGKLIKALTPPDSSSESDDDYKPNPKRMRFN